MRTAGDQWDIVSSVGWTALMVCAGRAVETHRPDGLVDDPYAERLVRRAGVEPAVPTRPDQRWPDPERVDGETTAADHFWSLMCAYQGVRSRFLDGELLAATRAGADQVVLLAAGLDARAHRLDWPAGTTVYEIDQEQVLGYKDDVLDDEPTRCRRVTVPVDLREDWVTALTAAGFDPTRPSVWLAEGLLPFLPPEAEDDLLRLVGTLAAPGSTIVVEHFVEAFRQMTDDPGVARVGRPFGVEMAELVDADSPRTHPADRLAADGWATATTPATEIAAGYGRPLPALPDGTSMPSEMVVGTR